AGWRGTHPGRRRRDDNRDHTDRPRSEITKKGGKELHGKAGARLGLGEQAGVIVALLAGDRENGSAQWLIFTRFHGGKEGRKVPTEKLLRRIAEEPAERGVIGAELSL